MSTTTTVEIYKDDEGTVLLVTVKENSVAKNISTATTKTVKFTKPGGDTVSKTLEFVTDGSDGQLDYTFEADLIDEVGKWVGQVYLEMPAGKWHTTTFEFNVKQYIVVS